MIGYLNSFLQTAASVLFLPFFLLQHKKCHQEANVKHKVTVSHFILKSGWISGFTPFLLSLEAGAD